jgi:Kef-type K+ transport system membrane component KefB
MHGFGGLFLSLAALIVAARLGAEAAQRIGQPAILGELLAGVIVGPGVLGVIDPAQPVIAALAELGVLVLLFEIGLHTDVRSLGRVGRDAGIVAIVGVGAPFALGFAAARVFGFDTLEALVAGAALTATSIGISARTLRDLGALESREGQVVLGAAVLDDLIGLIILGVVAKVAAGVAPSALEVGRSAAVALGFVVVSILVGQRVIPPIFARVAALRAAGSLGLVALAFALAMAAAAESAGSALIIGALAAGLVLHGTPQRHPIESSITALGYFVVPIFFAAVGAMVDPRAFASPATLGVGLVLTVVAIGGKLVAGFAPPRFRGRRLLVGVAMVPRGEVGLIFAQVALASGAIAAGEFGAIMLMVILTTVVTPPWLAALVRAAPPAHDARGDGLDDLVVGARRPVERATTAVRRTTDTD